MTWSWLCHHTVLNCTLIDGHSLSSSDYDWDDPEGAADKDDDDVADEIPEESKAI